MSGAKKSVVAKAERERRAKQSAKDKRLARVPAAKSRRLTVPRPRSMVDSAVSDYVRLVLDPCEAKLAHAVLPGSQGSFIFRLPYRFTVTIPSATVNIDGTSASNNTSICKNMTLGIFPHAMLAGVSSVARPSFFYAQGSALASNTFAGLLEVNNYAMARDPPALGVLTSLAGLSRPIAACIKCTYVGPAGQASGQMVAYEGPVNGIWKATSTTAPYDYYPGVSFDSLYTLGKGCSNSTASVEARINYAAVAPEWQEFKDVGITAGFTNEPTPNVSEFSTIPCATIALQDVTPGATYCVEGAAVYEWVPKLSGGLQVPERQAAKPGAYERASMMLSKAGRMLISFTDKLSQSNWMEKLVHHAGALSLKAATRAAPLMLTM